MVPEQNQSTLRGIPRFLPSLSNGRIYIMHTSSPHFIGNIRFTKRKYWSLSFPNALDTEEFDDITDDMLDFCIDVIFPLLAKKGYEVADNGLLELKNKELDSGFNVDLLENPEPLQSLAEGE